MNELPAEFDLIARYFRPLAGPAGLGLLDDAALFTPPPGCDLVITADTMVEGVHFLPIDEPDLIARKLLRVSLSDLAAKGAEPLGYLLSLSVRKETPEPWFAAFSAGLSADQEIFGIMLIGGDTTSTPGPVSLSLTAIGSVPTGAMVRRAGARPGDAVYVTGTIGDGALGLLAARGELDDAESALADRYHLPRPRLGLLQAGLVNAAMDVSDGLVQDLGHLCRAAGLGAEIDAARVPLSPAARATGPKRLALCLTGGDDYELLLAVSAEQEGELKAAAARIDIPLTAIGHFTDQPEIRVLDPDGTPMTFERPGWSHF